MYLLSGAFWDRGWGIKGTFGEYVDFYAGAWRGVLDGTAAVPYGVAGGAPTFLNQRGVSVFAAERRPF